MDNFNRIISFVLGLIVVIVFLVVISGRINLKGRFVSQNKPQSSPTPTVKIQPTRITTILPKKAAVKKTVLNPTGTKVKALASIPATGSPTVLIPLLLTSLSAGLYLLKKTKS